MQNRLPIITIANLGIIMVVILLATRFAFAQYATPKTP